MDGKLLISKNMADLLKRHGEDKILEVMNGWEKKCKWQRDRYHNVLKQKYAEQKKKMKEMELAERERKGQIPNDS